MATHPGLPDDAGAQPQRTVLAWQRTVVAVALGCATVAFTAQRQQLPAVAVLAAVAAVAMIAMLGDLRRWQVGGQGRYRLMHRAAIAVGTLAVLGVLVAVRAALG